jgi:high-affinity Fe2+/Pb2+ permease
MNTLMRSSLAALFQDAPAEPEGSATALRIGTGVLALILVGIVILRRKRAAKKQEDDEF